MDIAQPLAFLRQLASNNNKAWMDDHRASYQTALQSFMDLITYLLEELGADDEGLRGLDPKKCLFRINRDTRFSKDKSPYKTNFGAAMAEGGRHEGRPVYYLHLQPGDESFVAGGLYRPSGDVLTKIRQEIDYNAGELKEVTTAPDFRQYFGAIQGDALKRAPQGYDPSHPNIELLKLKDYLVIHKLTDQAVTDEGFPGQALILFRTMMPFVHYLDVAVS